MKKPILQVAILGLGVAIGQIPDSSRKVAAAAGEVKLPPCQDVNADGSSDISDAVFLLRWLFLGGPKPSCPADIAAAGLPDTGQSNCYGFDEDESWSVVLCTSRDTYPGQDGAFKTGCPSEGRFTDNGDGTISDSCTGLMWQKATADFDGVPPTQDAVQWPDALDYCASLQLAGHTDWRLPNVRELESLVDYGRTSPAIDPLFETLPAPYWSSTANRDVSARPKHAWAVHFGEGGVFSDDGSSATYVRAVRGGI